MSKIKYVMMIKRAHILQFIYPQRLGVPAKIVSSHKDKFEKTFIRDPLHSS